MNERPSKLTPSYPVFLRGSGIFTVKELETGRAHDRCMSEHISSVTRFLLTLSMFFVCATLGAGLALFTGWPVAILAGLVSFVFIQQIVASFARRRDKRTIAREMAHLRKGHLEFETALHQTRSRLTA